MEKSPFEKLIVTDSQEIPQLLLNPKVHYNVHRSQPLVPILSHMNTVYNFRTYFPKINSKYYLPRGLFLSGVPTKILYAFLTYPMRTTCTVHPIILDLINLIIFSKARELRSS
jgi:hypothetical protein